MKNETNTPAVETADETVSLSRRSALFKLGLATVAVYAAPALLTLSEAEAGKKSGKNTGKKSRKSKKSKKSRKSRKTRKTRKSRKSKKSRKSRPSRRSRR